MNKRVNLYIKDKVARERLEKQPNKSEYITRLILEDINKPNDKEKIAKIVQEILSQDKKNEIDPDLRKSISSMLDI